MRSCAEVLRLLAQRSSFDDEAKDMTAFLIFNLREIYKTIDESAQAWDERNYWKKAEGLREKWRWTRIISDKLTKLVVANKWQRVPEAMFELIPYFQSITIVKLTRDADWWMGAHTALLKEQKEG
ncbi:MAG: hypothetical protein AAF564_00680 [Bacteroidota bacterium]